MDSLGPNAVRIIATAWGGGGGGGSLKERGKLGKGEGEGQFTLWWKIYPIVTLFGFLPRGFFPNKISIISEHAQYVGEV